MTIDISAFSEKPVNPRPTRLGYKSALLGVLTILQSILIVSLVEPPVLQAKKHNNQSSAQLLGL
ncbi:hypothetical protein [Thorsellia kenyensis]|uniref:Uncharacterized protein n=1 Tax=Thorsellia kenyensis TaxID=1549888 RepID=A0ABV6CC21_9GAMM